MRNKIILGVVLLAIAGYLYSLFGIKKPDESVNVQPETVPNLPYKLVNSFSFDTSNYVEGLEFVNDKLYAGAGEKGNSFIGIYDLKTGKSVKHNTPGIFGEGITVLNNVVYQLTYTEKIVNKYDLATMKKIGEMPWKFNEGWGLTNNGKELIASDGTNNIYFLNPTDLGMVRSLNITANGGIVNQINELEYVDGVIYANQFTTDLIYKIDATSGKVLAIANLDQLFPAYNAAATKMKDSKLNLDEQFFNGIAYNKTTKTFFVTGKKWPKIFEVSF